jgi:hypothetical protein
MDDELTMEGTEKGENLDHKIKIKWERDWIERVVKSAIGDHATNAIGHVYFLTGRKITVEGMIIMYFFNGHDRKVLGGGTIGFENWNSMTLKSTESFICQQNIRQ